MQVIRLRALVGPLALAALVGVVLIRHAGAATVLHSTRVSANPSSVVVDGRDRRVFVVDRDAGMVDVLDADTGALLRTMTVGDALGALTVDERTGRAFVTNRSTGSVSVLDARSGALLRTVVVHRDAYGIVDTLPVSLAVSERTGRVFVGDENGRVAMLDARTGAVLSSADLSSGTNEVSAPVLAVAGGTRRIFISTGSSGAVTTLDARSGKV